MQARQYAFDMVSHSRAEQSALNLADKQSEAARKHLEVARLIALDSQLDRDRFTYACSSSLVQKYPRLEAAWRQTLMLSRAEREDILHGLEADTAALLRASEYAGELAKYQARLKLKYMDASHCPWLQPEADPPPPVPKPLP
jgi:hypothetical protein